MISANELRINNFVNYKDDANYYSIRALCKDRVNDINIVEHDGNNRYAVECLLDDISGIPLTEEILLKCGARRIDKYTFVLNGLFIHMRKIGFVFNVGKKKIIIENLHTLQNLIFALTGQELTINI